MKLLTQIKYLVGDVLTNRAGLIVKICLIWLKQINVYWCSFSMDQKHFLLMLAPLIQKKLPKMIICLSSSGWGQLPQLTNRLTYSKRKKIACYSFIIHWAILLNDNNISIQSIYVTFALSRRILILWWSAGNWDWDQAQSYLVMLGYHFGQFVRTPTVGCHSEHRYQELYSK